MPLRPMSALCILLLAGCASSEPKNEYYASPAGEAAALQGAPPAETPHVTTLPAPASYDQSGQLPVGPAAPAALQPGCSTVDNVTLCDAPADPSGDDTLHTN